MQNWLFCRAYESEKILHMQNKIATSFFNCNGAIGSKHKHFIPTMYVTFTCTIILRQYMILAGSHNFTESNKNKSTYKLEWIGKATNIDREVFLYISLCTHY